MSKTADQTGHRDKSANYSRTAREYLKFWTQHGINTQANPRHTMLQYDSPQSHGT